VFESARLANEQIFFNERRDNLTWFTCNPRYLSQDTRCQSCFWFRYRYCCVRIM